MRNMIVTFGAVAALAGCCTCGIVEKSDYASTVEEGFVNLFNGYNLNGWQGATETYGVTRGEPGVLQCLPKKADGKEGSAGHLATKKKYRNFILRFEYCMPEGGNNGVGLRMQDTTHEAAYYGMCEVQLIDDNRPDLKDWQFTGSIYGVKPARRDNIDCQIWGKEKNFCGNGSFARIPGMWNFEEIRVAGEEIEVYLNGYLVNKVDLSKYKGDGDTIDGKKHPGMHSREGFIGWMGHGHNVKWRNIRVKELPDNITMAELAAQTNAEVAPKGFTTFFAGKAEDLAANWKGVTTEEHFDWPEVRQKADPAKRAQMQAIADKGMREHWSVRNGALFFDGFKGGYSLATKKDYGDFELWADWRLLSVTGDSGLYLRGVPQVQIWDAYNFWHIGSGGLYNNKKNPSNALAIADRQIGDWNRFHIVMKGEKVWVWLNGVLVTDGVVLENIRDRSKPVYACEQIELQCHGDPIEWRNVFIREL